MSSKKKKKKQVQNRKNPQQQQNKKSSAEPTVLKKTTVTPDLNSGKHIAKVGSEYEPLIVAIVTAVVAFLLTFVFREAPVCFRVVFPLSTGLLAGGVSFMQTAERKAAKLPKGVYVIMSGVASFLGLLSIYAFMEIFPFGSNSVVTVDMGEQYIPFYTSLRDHLFGGGSMLYSQSMGMGGNYLALMGYYLGSPFALLSMLFPKDNVIDFMAIQELIKLSLMGGFFAYFYKCRFGRDDAILPIISLCYSMSSFMLLHLCTIVWTDCFVLLPLIVLGVDKIARGDKPWLYVICLTISCFSNYYITYMICIYLVLYFIATLICDSEKLVFKDVAVKFLKFAGYSLLSVGMFAFMLLPSGLSVGAAYAGEAKSEDGILSANPLKILQQLMYNADFNILGDASLPLIYCSIFVLTLLPLFFACKKIPTKVKISLGSILGILFVSLLLNGLNVMWHGMRIPNMLPYRFAFLLIFTMLIMAGYVIENIGDISSNAFTFVLVGVIAVSLIAYFAGGGENMIMLVGTLGLAVAYTVVFVLRSENKMRTATALSTAIAVVFIEIVTNGALSWQHLGTESSYNIRNEYIERCATGRSTVESIKVSDSDIYRMELLSNDMINDCFVGKFSSLSCFSSVNSGGLMHMLSKVGFNCDERVAYYYKGYTPLMDSVLNLKYIAFDMELRDVPYLEKQEVDSALTVYRNKMVLPRAFAVSEKLLNWDIEKDNPFEVQNDFVKYALDSEQTVYINRKLDIDKSNSFGAVSENGAVSFGESGGMLTLNYAPKERANLYVYINCGGASTVSVTVNENEYKFDEKDSYVVDLGYCGEGDSVNIRVTADKQLDGYISAATMDESAFESVIQQLNAVPSKFDKYDDTYISCHVNVENNCLLFTSIPYDANWSAYVNGEKVQLEAIGGGLIGVPLSAGENTVELKYWPRGLTVGIVISLICLVITLVLGFYNKIISFLQFCKLPRFAKAQK